MAKSAPQHRAVTAPETWVLELWHHSWWAPPPALMCSKEAWDALALCNNFIPLCVCMLSDASAIIYIYVYKARKWIEISYPVSAIHPIWLLQPSESRAHGGYLYFIASSVTGRRESSSLVITYLRASESPSVSVLCLGREPRLLGYTGHVVFRLS